jgi:hypothetical protein
MEKNSLPSPKKSPSNVFVDRGRVLFVTHQITHIAMAHPLDGQPITWGPYWNTAMAVGAFSNPPVELGEEGSTIWAFIDEDDNLLALDMPNPRQEGTGPPKEEILLVLRQILPEDEITEILETLLAGFQLTQIVRGGEIRTCSPTRAALLHDLALLTDQSHPAPQTDSSNTVTIKVEEGSTAEDFLSQLFEAAEEAGAVTEEFIEIPEIPETRGRFFRKRT